MDLSIIVPISGLISLVFAAYLVFKISRQSSGNKKMQEISNAIREGAMAFLNSENKILVVFITGVSTLLYALSLVSGSNMHWGTTVAFIIGAILSILSGNIGMRIATLANAKTAEGSKESINKGLSVAFSSGAVMGITVVGLGVLGVWGMYMLFTNLIPAPYTCNPGQATTILFGFSFGASSVALFARVGGGIYTKSADVGADLVGKVEENIPEDDPRNPAVIADLVGDNVGDVAGMGADLYESYVESIIAPMALAAIAGGFAITTYGSNAIILPLIIAALGIFASIIGIFFVRTGKESNVYSAMRNGLFASAILVTVLGGMATWYLLDGELKPYYAMLAGLIAGIIIGLNTEYFASEKQKPVRQIAEASKTGPATVVIQGLVTGMTSTIVPVVSVVAAMVIAYYFAEFYGVAISAVGMLSILGMSLATDCYGPVADNAAGIAEMSGMGQDVRERAETLDAVGNTTAAMGKGFAIGSAAITALALIATFIVSLKLYYTGPEIEELLSLGGKYSPYLVSGVFIGALLPFVFVALTMGAVGKAAHKMVEEVRYQFKEFHLLTDPKAKPDYTRCVSISTKRALQAMILPGLMAVSVPIIVGMVFGPAGLAGLLLGSIATGFLLAIFLANAGGAWDNAKKYIEAGNLGGKGSLAHKAAVIGDTVGDPCKDTSGPALNILIKLMSVVSLVFLPLIVYFHS
ncbi:MAG: sodium-translocating pyrophosphatase [Methanocellales archaeon]|nr:sodium-translocating pyrophosphatase [Methanocellales archaeon]MDD3291423.1 sodium-translocating pyrophosphatase [Methanocellales archaeon]MDD5234687.1 sodium-translocating pyrophosphatase [Methanocellales archaeon]MDD5484962.1 sodium-translocating pyrophosphatase [Methanocellales archaeon]